MKIISKQYWKKTKSHSLFRKHKILSNFPFLNSPICSTISGGNTREANARRKISENSLSRPPIPIFSKFQSGLMIDWRFSLVLALPTSNKDNQCEARTSVSKDKTPWASSMNKEKLPLYKDEQHGLCWCSYKKDKVFCVIYFVWSPCRVSKTLSKWLNSWHSPL